MNVPEKHRQAELLQALADGYRLEVLYAENLTWRQPSETDLGALALDNCPRGWQWRISLTKPSIDWSHVDKRYNWLAKNDDGNAFLYDRVPWSQGYAFVGWAGSYVRADAFSSYSPGTCDWRDSLIVRPGYEGEKV